MIKAPTKQVRYSIPYFLAVRYDLTLDQLKDCAADISTRIDSKNTSSANINEIASEFLSPAFSCVRSIESFPSLITVSRH